MNAVLITGAGGYLGRLLADELLSRSERPVWLWLHARDADTRARSTRALAATLGPRAACVRIFGGDLTASEPFAEVPPAGVGAIIHAAAITRFNVEAEAATAVNVDGTAKALAFARRCPGLTAFSYVSTLYASGLRSGDIAEAPLAAGGFANHYEASKWAAEALVLGASAAFAVRVLRLPTLVVDDEGGGITQHNAFHNTLRLLRAGLLALMPGQAETPLFLGSGRFAARAAVRLTLDPAAAGVYHLVHGPADALPLGALLARAFARFGEDPAFRARRLLPPPLCDRATFAEVAGALGTVGGPLLVAALGSLIPFAPQLYAGKRFDNRRLRAALPDEAPPAAATLVRAALDGLCAERCARTTEGAA